MVWNRRQKEITNKCYTYRIGTTRARFKNSFGINCTTIVYATLTESLNVEEMMVSLYRSPTFYTDLLQEAYEYKSNNREWNRPGWMTGVTEVEFFDDMADELFDYSRNKDVTREDVRKAEDRQKGNSVKIIPVAGEDIKPDYSAVFMYMREPSWHYTINGVDWE